MARSPDSVDRRALERVVLYGLVLLLLSLVSRHYLRLSLVVPLFLPLALLDSRPRKFLIAWVPLALIVVSYDLMRGAIDPVAAYVDFTTLPRMEETLTGFQPVLWLQANWLPFLENPLGFFPTLIYFSHFVVPIVLLYALWRVNTSDFLTAAASISLLSYAGFATFLAFPAAPPWMAGEAGVLPPVRHVVLEHLAILYRLVPSFDLSSAYTELTANQVAPFPSLHAGYACLIALWVVRYFKSNRWLGPVYGFAASFVIVLYGEHYVVDVIGGWLYALAAFAAATYLSHLRLTRRLIRYLDGP